MEFYGEVVDFGEKCSGNQKGSFFLRSRSCRAASVNFAAKETIGCQAHHIYGFKDDAQGGFANI